jgi:hypothetical protein
MKLAIMQPYFLPYIGYFQLIAAADVFVVYDNIKYTKKGWINRNRMLQNGADVMFSLPLKSDSDYLDVRERALAADFSGDKLLNQIAANYRRAPQFGATFALVEAIVRNPERNLFAYLHQGLLALCAHLAITTPIRVSSTLPIDHALKNQDKVLALCEAAGADQYVNSIGGVELYEGAAFRARGIELEFIRARPFEYPQLGAPFVPWLSILDVLMFNPLDAVRAQVASGYELVAAA